MSNFPDGLQGRKICICKLTTQVWMTVTKLKLRNQSSLIPRSSLVYIIRHSTLKRQTSIKFRREITSSIVESRFQTTS